MSETPETQTAAAEETTPDAEAPAAADASTEPTEQAEAEADKTEVEKPEAASAAREAAKWRKQFREAESQVAALTERLTALQRREVERLASADMADPEDLWRSGVELTELLDEDGNVEIQGARGLDLSMAFAARRVLVTVEEIVPRGTFQRSAAPRAFILGRSFVTAVAHVPFGAYPTSCVPYYAADYRELAGLNRTTPLIAPGLRERHRQRQGPRLRRLHAEGRIVTWADDPDWFAAVKSQAVQALRDGLRPEARQRRRALWDEARRARQGAWRRARNLAGERATPEQIAAGIRRGTITCERCGAVVPRTGTRQRLCPDCRREHERAYQREWKQRKRARGALRGAARTA